MYTFIIYENIILYQVLRTTYVKISFVGIYSSIFFSFLLQYIFLCKKKYARTLQFISIIFFRNSTILTIPPSLYNFVFYFEFYGLVDVKT